MKTLYFAYAGICGKRCKACRKTIQKGKLFVECDLEVSYVEQYYHFQCLIDTCSFDDCQKEDIKIYYIRNPKEILSPRYPFVTLKIYDKNPKKFRLGIKIADLKIIREKMALAKEHKTLFFIPRVSKNLQIDCLKECIHDTSNDSAKKLGLLFQGTIYHPECLANTGKINVDAKEIIGYDKCSNDEQTTFDNLFKKDDVNYNHPKVRRSSTNHEFCSFYKCLKIRFHNRLLCDPKIGGLRMRYQTKAYHPKCFAVMGKVNNEATEVCGYEVLTESQKKSFVNCLKKSENFDIPCIKLAEEDDYCCRHKCYRARSPSKFPYPYTISAGNTVIRFHGEYYHPKCFKSEIKTSIPLEDFRNYDLLDTDELNMFKEIFQQNDDDENLDQLNNGDQQDFDDATDIMPEVEQEYQQNDIIIEELQQEDDPDTVPQTYEQQSTVFVLNYPNNDETEEPTANMNSILSRPNYGNNVDGILGGNGNNQMDDSDDLDDIEPPAKKIKLKQKTESENETETNQLVANENNHGDNEIMYEFEVPNYAFIRSTLDKLQFPINRQALSFWAKVAYDVIPSTSTPTSTFPLSSADDSFFKCLSCFFTGDECAFDCVKAGIQSYFRTSFKTFGTLDGVDFSKLYVTSKEVKDLYECKKLTNK